MLPVSDCYLKFNSNPKATIFVRTNGILMISPLVVSRKNVKVSQKRRLGTYIESFTGSSLSEQIIKYVLVDRHAEYLSANAVPIYYDPGQTWGRQVSGPVLILTWD